MKIMHLILVKLKMRHGEAKHDPITRTWVAAVKRTAENVFNEFRDPVLFSAILIRHNGKTESSPFIKPEQILTRTFIHGAKI